MRTQCKNGIRWILHSISLLSDLVGSKGNERSISYSNGKTFLTIMMERLLKQVFWFKTTANWNNLKREKSLQNQFEYIFYNLVLPHEVWTILPRIFYTCTICGLRLDITNYRERNILATRLYSSNSNEFGCKIQLCSRSFWGIYV